MIWEAIMVFVSIWILYIGIWLFGRIERATNCDPLTLIIASPPGTFSKSFWAYILVSGALTWAGLILAMYWTWHMLKGLGVL